MYLCLEQDKDITWFEPQDTSLYEIATFYQKGGLSIKFINNKLLVKLYNVHRYLFHNSKKYNLFLEPDNMGNLQITLKFDKGDYVADMYRMPIDNIKPETWKALQVRNIPDYPTGEDNDNHWYAPDITDDSEQSESSDDDCDGEFETPIIHDEIEN